MEWIITAHCQMYLNQFYEKNKLFLLRQFLAVLRGTKQDFAKISDMKIAMISQMS